MTRVSHQPASISYLAPLGNGLRVDFGKFVTHIGGETIETILIRPEYRVDVSNKDFFTRGADFRATKTQHTLGVGAVFYF